MHGWKLMLTALGTGALLGTIGGTTISPALKPPPEQPWRQGNGPQHAPTATYEIVEAGPQDLSPQGWTYGARRAFSEDRRPAARRSAAYRFEDEIPPQEAAAEDVPIRPGLAAPAATEIPPLEAAEAARDAARDAAEAGAVTPPADQPPI